MTPRARAAVGGTILIWLVAVFGASPASAQTPPRPADASSVREAASKIPPEAFYARPDIETAVLSPSGRWLALRSAAAGGRAMLAVFDTVEWKMQGIIARFSEVDIDEVHWVGDERLVFTIEDRQRGGGDQRWWPGLWSVARDGSDLRELINPSHEFFTTGSRVGREPLRFNHMLLHVPTGAGSEVIIGEYRFDSAGEFVELIPKRLDVSTGRTRLLAASAPDNVWRWLFDAAGEPRLAVTRHRGRMSYQWRAPGATSWRVLAEFAALHPPYVPLWLDAAGTVHVGLSAGADGTRVLRRLDLAAGQPERENLFSTPGFDFWGYSVTESPGARMLGIRAITDAETTVWFDARMKALQAEADARWPALVTRLSCRRCDSPDMTVLMTGHSDRDPGQYWIYRAATKEWRMVGEQRSAIVPRLMGMTDFERVPARDGLSLPVWVTRPAGTAKGPLPTVLLVHGGPWSRGRHWAWNDDAQFLASRGYLVIEPEFRGSTGYGQRLYRAGFKQWGRAMQDDLQDVLAWAVKQGHTDAARVCIAGASYGGYATLMGLVRYPEQYRCGVAWAAVTDPRLLFKWMSSSDIHTEHREHTLPELIGDPVADAAMLESVTPLLLADRIRAPLFLAFGSDDRRVPLVHGERLRDALVAAGRPPEQWVVYASEGHGWFKLETRVDFARRLEAFLARHLAPAR
jgi:dienelactone hydrolase